MADNEKEAEGTSSHGADWEVVSLTASAYAAAHGSKEFDQDDENTANEKDNERQSPDALFMSHHFVFPPSEHENLPIEPELIEIHNVLEGRSVSFNVDANDGFDEADEEKLLTEFVDGSHEVEFFDEGSSVSIQNVAFKERKGFQSNIEFTETDEYDMSYEVSEESLASTGNSAKQSKEDKFDGSNLPCEARWKRHSTSLYRHAKEANTFWSVVVAAAVMGLVIMGQRWQKDKWQLHQLKLQFGISEEKLIRMIGPIGRLKDILIGSHQHRPLIQGVGATANL